MCIHSSLLHSYSPLIWHRSIFYPSSSNRVAVIGAGISGLTAAYNLKKLGYSVTVFEADNRVGGKIESVYLPNGAPSSDFIVMDDTMEAKVQALCGDQRPTELGAIATWGENMVSLMDEVDVPYGVIVLDEYNTVVQFLRPTNNTNTNNNFNNTNTRQELVTALLSRTEYSGLLSLQFAPDQDPEEVVGAAVQAFFQTVQLFPEIATLRLDGHDPELAMPMSAFAEKYGFSVLVEGMKPNIVGYGYGYFETVPAGIQMKFLHDIIMDAGSGPSVAYALPCGFQSLLESMAIDIDVRLNAKVSSITRSDDSIMVELMDQQPDENTQFEFNHLVISTTVDVVPNFLDVDETEAELFGGNPLDFIRYITTVANITTHTNDLTIDFYSDQAIVENINHVSLVLNPNMTTTAAKLAYQIVDSNITKEDALAVLDEDMTMYWPGSVGAGGAIAQRDTHNYFPTVSSQVFADGFYDKMEALQGAKNTYYVGSYLLYELTTMAETYSRELVLRKFEPVE